MSWVKLDDQVLRNRKVRAMIREHGTDPFALWIAGLLYCTTAETDGVIEPYDLPLVAAEAQVSETCAAALEAFGLWDRLGEGWHVHDYLEFQPSRAELTERRRRDRERKRKDSTTDSGRDSTRIPPRTPTPPSRPVPSPDSSSSSQDNSNSDTAPVDDDEEVIHGVALRDVWCEVAEHRATISTKPIGSRASWLAKVREGLPDELGEQAREVLELYDLRSAREVSDVLVGKRSKQHLPLRKLAS